MHFISNTESQHHLSNICRLFELSDEVYVAVAFLKTSGLNSLLSSIEKHIKADKAITIVAGSSFGFTEPNALKKLKSLFDGRDNAKLYLTKQDIKKVFHPKLYLFRSGQSCDIIAGSANLTDGGLSSNAECSIHIQCHQDDKAWQDAFNFLQNAANEADKADILTIKKYEPFYEQQKKHHKLSKIGPYLTKSQKAFNYSNLNEYFQDFDEVDRDNNFNAKVVDYKKAKKILNQIADHTNLTKQNFVPLLDSLVGKAKEGRLWHSGSLYRRKKEVYPYYKQFQELVKYIRANKDASPEVVFSKAVEKVKSIKGASINYVAEIMMTYNPEKFANLNSNPITVLKKEGGVHLKTSSESFNGEDYEEYCELIKEISSALGIRNMLEADSFFNDIYWKIKSN
jgi:HKD family nuclease